MALTTTLAAPCAPRPAAAQDDDRASGHGAREQAPQLGAVGTVARPIAATQQVDPTASGTSVPLGGENRPLANAEEALRGVPGLRVRRRGGPAAPVLVALRGAEVGHTAVLLDAIPLTTPDASAFDLSLLPVSAFERIEVFRGGAPVWYGQGSIGGVVRYVPAVPEDSWMQASAGLGSFGQHELLASAAVASRSGRSSLLSHARWWSADNDYEFDDNDGLGFTPGASVRKTMLNAEQDAGDALLHATTEVAGGRLSALIVGHGRLEGLPGPQAVPARQAQRKLVRGLAGVGFEREGYDEGGNRLYRVQVGLSGSFQRNLVTDLESEIGRTLELASDDLWSTAELRLAGGYALLPFVELNAVGALRYDGYAPVNRAAFANPPRPSRRHSQAMALESRLHGDLLGMRAELRPSIRWQWSQTSIRATEERLNPVTAKKSETVPTYRVGAVLEPVAGVAVSASAATGTRLPGISALFGDRAFQEPNPSLRPERSVAYDAGLTITGTAGPLSGAVELRGFVLQLEDLIRFRRTSQFTVRPVNEATAELKGAELGLRGQVGRYLSLVGAATVLDTRDAKGTELPFRPPVTLFVHPRLTLPLSSEVTLGAFCSAHFVSYFYYGELAFQPGRTLFSGGFDVQFGRTVRLEASAQNLFGTQPLDVLSRPLPGRSFRLAVTVRDDL